MQTERTLEQMNAAQLKTIQELTQKVKDLEIWERFVGYLLDSCEGQTISEEGLQAWMGGMLAKEAEPPVKK